ncbi:MAG: hypothetical protein J6O40_02830 [Ruminococcus sp.]|nr:hypothetical protein [Ruminococcus sp.]
MITLKEKNKVDFEFDKDDKMALGIIGAFIGAVLAMGLWCLLGYFGKMAFICGIAMCVGVIGGYYLFGNGMSIGGFVICCVLLIAAVYFSTRISYGLWLYNKLDGTMSFGDCYGKIIDLLETLGEKSSFYKDLALGYLFTIGGGFYMLFKLGIIDN